MNVVVFHGKEVLQADHIQEKKREVNFPKEGTEKYINVIHDIVNEVDFHTSVVLTSIENQSDIHYAMPVRVIVGECAFYHEQWKTAANLHKKNKDLSGAEYISGFSKTDFLTPTITLVLYFGEKSWDGPKCLYDMIDVENIPEELREYIVNYPIFLVEVRKIKKLECFKTDIRYVFGYIQNTSDKMKMCQYIKENREVFECMPEDAYDFMSSVSHTKELKVLKEKYKNAEGGIDMCRAIYEMVEDGRREGLQEGRLEGRLESVRFLKLRAEDKTNYEIAEECAVPVEEVEEFFELLS